MTLQAGALSIDCLQLGVMMTNCYVLVAADACWVVDPGFSPQPLLDHLGAKRLSPQRILLTHGHCDHIAGIDEAKDAFPEAIVTAPAGDASMLDDPMANLSLPFGFDVRQRPADQTVRPGQELAMGTIAWRILDVAGHSPGGVAYHCPAAEVVIVGDALFADSIGRTDIPGADHDRLIANIRRNLLTLPDATRVLPGHGPPTTVAAERAANPYLS
jgi:hydroxyacylglutathione hydrolase